jgi:gamma-glutamyltranspeptidase/glutathione hydrolase
MSLRPVTAAAPALAAVLALAACARPAPDPVPQPPLAGKRVEARRGMVVSSASDASNAGLAVLQQGGNAVDAAVATSFALGVVDPSQTGLGGYAVGVVWLARERRAEVLEAMGQAGADPAWGQPDPERPRRPTSFDGGDAREPRTALVPGFVSGLLALHERHGRLPRAAVLAPAVRLAREGFVVGPLNHRLFAASVEKLRADSAAAALFLPGGEPPRVGDRLVQPQLAALLEALARDGARAMYEGEVAARIAAKTRAVGGLLDAADLAAYRPLFVRPTCATFNGLTFLAAPGPVGGPTVAEILQLAEAGGALRLGDPVRDTAAAVRWADAIRVGNADRRAYPGHPEWAPGAQRGVASAGFARTRAALVGAPVADSLARGDAWAHEGDALPAACAALDPFPATARPAAPRASDGSGDDGAAHASQTSHLVVVDADRNVVSLTSSVGVLFGSGVFAEGIFLNSSGNLFARGERAPRRRPGSGIAPTLLLDARQRPRFAAGAGGAAYIIPAVSQVLLRMAGLGQDPWTALQAPRVQPTAAGRALELEQGFALPVYGALRAHGYLPSNRVANLQFAGVHAVAIRPDGVIVGAADPRRDGTAAGY